MPFGRSCAIRAGTCPPARFRCLCRCGGVESTHLAPWTLQERDGCRIGLAILPCLHAEIQRAVHLVQLTPRCRTSHVRLFEALPQRSSPRTRSPTHSRHDDARAHGVPQAGRWHGRKAKPARAPPEGRGHTPPHYHHHRDPAMSGKRSRVLFTPPRSGRSVAQCPSCPREKIELPLQPLKT